MSPTTFFFVCLFVVPVGAADGATSAFILTSFTVQSFYGSFIMMIMGGSAAGNNNEGD